MCAAGSWWLCQKPAQMVHANGVRAGPAALAAVPAPLRALKHLLLVCKDRLAHLARILTSVRAGLVVLPPLHGPLLLYEVQLCPLLTRLLLSSPGDCTWRRLEGGGKINGPAAAKVLFLRGGMWHPSHIWLPGRGLHR